MFYNVQFQRLPTLIDLRCRQERSHGGYSGTALLRIFFLHPKFSCTQKNLVYKYSKNKNLSTLKLILPPATWTWQRDLVQYSVARHHRVKSNRQALQCSGSRICLKPISTWVLKLGAQKVRKGRAKRGSVILLKSRVMVDNLFCLFCVWLWG